MAIELNKRVKNKLTLIPEINTIGLKSTAKAIQLEYKKKPRYTDGFLDGFRYACNLVENQILTEEELSDLAWKYSSEYTTNINQHGLKPLFCYISDVLKAQNARDAVQNNKKFRLWLEKALNICIEVSRLELTKMPGERIEIDIDGLLQEIKGIEL